MPIWVLLQGNSSMQALLLVLFISGWTLLKDVNGRHHQTIIGTWRICHSPGAGWTVIRKAGFLSSRSILFCWKSVCVLWGEPSEQFLSRILMLSVHTFNIFNPKNFQGKNHQSWWEKHLKRSSWLSFSPLSHEEWENNERCFSDSCDGE